MDGPSCALPSSLSFFSSQSISLVTVVGFFISRDWRPLFVSAKIVHLVEAPLLWRYCIHSANGRVFSQKSPMEGAAGKDVGECTTRQGVDEEKERSKAQSRTYSQVQIS